MTSRVHRITGGGAPGAPAASWSRSSWRTAARAALAHIDPLGPAAGEEVDCELVALSDEALEELATRGVAALVLA